MNRLSLTFRKYGVDALIVLAAIGSVLEVLLRHDELRSPQTTAWFTVPAIALLVLVLLGRRRFPFAAPVSVWLLASALSFVDGRLVVFTFAANLAGMVSAFLLGNLRDAVQLRIGLIVMVSASIVIVYNDPNHSPGEFIFIPVIFVLSWLVGFAMRERTAQAEAAEERAAEAERERESAARLAVAEERSRIARELHDVVAHAMSVMVLQVGAVRHRLPPELEEDREALTNAEQAGRTALSEMRRLLGAMRSDGDGAELAPQPGLDNLDKLLQDINAAGLPVRLHVEGDRFSLPRAIDLSAYRIVQEGLTNALKHANASHADVTIGYGSDELTIEIRDDGVGRGGSTGDGSGHGLIGVRERVKIYRGEMTAGDSPGGGFLLTTRLPLGGDGR